MTKSFTRLLRVKLRRLLTIEQYRSERIASIFRETSFDKTLEYQAKLFDGMVRAGRFIKADPYMMALAFLLRYF